MATTRYTLNAEGIQSCLASFDQINDKYFRDQKHRLKARLVIETLLLKNQEHFGENEKFLFKCTERFHHIYLSIEVRGEIFDPRQISLLSGEELGTFILKMSGTFEKRPAYHYVNGLNKTSMSLKREKKMGSAAKMGIAVCLGLLLSLLGMVLPSFFKDNILPVCNQINDVVLGLIKMSATLVVFFMIINSITSCGSLTNIKKMGGNVIKGFLIRYGILIVMLVAYFFFMFDFTIVSPEQKGGLLSAITEILAGVFPVSYVTPFVEANFLQIIFIGILVGIAILVIGEPAVPFLKLCESMDTIGTQIMEWCCSLLPIFIALVIPTILWSDDLSLISNALVHVIGIIIIGYLLFLIFFFIMCRKRKMGIGASFKIIFPSLIKALLTASSTATLPTMLEASKKFGVKDGFNDLASIFGFIFSVCACIASYGIMMFYLLMTYHVDITVALLIKLILSVFLLGIASPPVSGGTIAIMAILASMFGLPDTCVSLVTPIMIILDFFNTSARCGDIVTQTVISAVDMDEIEEARIKNIII